MEDSYLSVDFNSSLDPETNFISCYVEFDLINIITEEKTTIGSGSLYLINTFLEDSWFEIIDAADSISGDMHNIVYQLADILEEESDFLGLLAILDHIKIKETYREKGYGTKGISEIIKYLETLEFDYFALIPFPFEEKDENKKHKGIQRLVNFYKKFHLKVVNKESETEPIMGRNLNLKLPAQI